MAKGDGPLTNALKGLREGAPQGGRVGHIRFIRGCGGCLALEVPAGGWTFGCGGHRREGGDSWYVLGVAYDITSAQSR